MNGLLFSSFIKADSASIYIVYGLILVACLLLVIGFRAISKSQEKKAKQLEKKLLERRSEESAQ